ncbi:type IV secretion system DotC family protein [Rhizobium laguerreae]|uniref:type IV secretory system conjugative DNA transfer family protein n=1 Tax=Rhizobium laguerreae TaxID=1076926 RepID=UPI001C9288D0|nr:type IV secretory system conjugative DNA transfer family protein [Rhizobium laguerreae]MBY3155275.1 type IV secretion system DotC family protein [Rhizobium laguerreae]
MKFRYLAAVSLIALSTAGCTTTSDVMPGQAVIDSPKDAPLRADINPGYKAGSVDFKTAPTRSLDQIMAKDVYKPKKAEPKEGEDKLRLPAMEETALAYGTRAGLAYETAQINKRLEANANLMTKAYNFQNLMLQGPNNTMVSPPIISEAVDAWEAFDAGKTLRVADTVYEIIEQSRFTPVAPMWQTYLIVRFDEAQQPPEALQPQTEGEKDRWNRWIKQGWDKGREQAHDIFKANLDRLNRDFTGMVRYKSLLEENKVSAPILTAAPLGTTGTGQDMRVNDNAIRMTAEPQLQVNNKGWEASATTLDAAGEPKGPDKVAPKVEEKPKPAPRKPRPAKPKTPTAQPKPIVSNTEKTSGGDGRF